MVVLVDARIHVADEAVAVAAVGQGVVETCGRTGTVALGSLPAAHFSRSCRWC